MTEFGTLPNEMIVAVFEHLCPADLFICYNVCRTWRTLVDQVLGLVLHVGKGVEEIWESQSVNFRSIKNIAKFGVSQACFSELGGGDTTLTPVKFKHPQLLKKIWVDGHISPEIFNRFSKDLPNLQKLTFHISTLSVVPMKNLELSFGSLTYLKISMFKDEAMPDTNDAMIVENLTHIMTRPFVFNSLTTLTIHLPFIVAEALNMTQAIVKFMLLHKNSLRHIFLSLEGDGVVNAGAPGAAPEISDEEIAGMKMHSFVLHSALPNHVSTKNLRSIMARQSELRSMYCTTGYHRLSGFKRVFIASASTLTTIQLTIAVERDGSGVDLAPLASCKSLKVLALSGPEKEDDTEDPFEENEDDIEGRMLTEDVYGISQLPNSLRVFKLYNLFVLSQEIKSLIQKPNLRVFRLDNIGRFGNLGITLQDVFDVMGTKRLKSFLWKDCINVRSIVEARNGTDPNAMLCAIIARRLHGDDGLQGYWNERFKRYEVESTSKEPEVLASDHPEFILANGTETFTMTDEAGDDSDSDDDEAEQADDADDEEEGENVEDAEDEENLEEDVDDEEIDEDVEEIDEDVEEMDVEVEDEEEDTDADEP